MCTILACTVGGLAKFLCHFLAGVLYWPDTSKFSAVVYSLLYNGSYMLPSIILCVIVMVIIVKKQPKLLSK